MSGRAYRTGRINPGMVHTKYLYQDIGTGKIFFFFLSYLALFFVNYHTQSKTTEAKKCLTYSPTTIRLLYGKNILQARNINAKFMAQYKL
jgi:hypothetical protein